MEKITLSEAIRQASRKNNSVDFVQQSADRDEALDELMSAHSYAKIKIPGPGNRYEVCPTRSESKLDRLLEKSMS